MRTWFILAIFWPRLKVNFGHASVDFGHASVILATRLHDFGHEFGIGGQNSGHGGFYFGHALILATLWPLMCLAAVLWPAGQNAASSVGCILAMHAFDCSPVACRPKCGQNILATYSRAMNVRGPGLALVAPGRGYSKRLELFKTLKTLKP